MTDRLKGCTVVFKKDTREDDAERMLDAIRMVTGVLDVVPVIAEMADVFAEARVRRDLGERLLAVLSPPEKP